MSTELARVEFSSEQVSLIKRTICQGSTDDELSLFLAQCKRTGLDPFARQIHAVKRWDKKQNREIMSIQIGIDGFRLIGARTGEADGQEGPYWCGKDGVWKDVWLSDEYPVAAKVLVYRKGRSHPYVGIAHWSEYAQTYKDGNPLPMWAQMPAGQLAKCAEALAQRKAFPQELSGLYSPEELSHVDERPAEPKPHTNGKPQPALPPKADTQLAGTYAAKLEAATSAAEAEQVIASINGDIAAKLLTKADTERLAPVVVGTRAKFAEPQIETLGPEGEQRADPPSATTTPAATTAAPKVAKATPTPEPAGGVQKAGGHIVQVILGLAHEIGVSWPEIRDGVEKGGEIAAAAALPKLPIDFKVTSLSAEEALRLHKVLTERVEKKKANAAKRADNAKRREAEEVGAA